MRNHVNSCQLIERVIGTWTTTISYKPVDWVKSENVIRENKK